MSQNGGIRRLPQRVDDGNLLEQSSCTVNDVYEIKIGSCALHSPSQRMGISGARCPFANPHTRSQSDVILGKVRIMVTVVTAIPDRPAVAVNTRDAPAEWEAVPGMEDDQQVSVGVLGCGFWTARVVH